MIHVGTFISLSSELAVAAAPLQYRLSKGQLYQRMTIRELQVKEEEEEDVFPYTYSVFESCKELIFFTQICQQSQAPAIDWLGSLQAAFHLLPLTEDDHVLLHNSPYIMQMSRIVGKWLNKHELSARYCKWHITPHHQICIHFLDSLFILENYFYYKKGGWD